MEMPASHPDTNSTSPRLRWFAQLCEWLFLAWIATLPVMQVFQLRVAHRYTVQIADFLFVGVVVFSLLAIGCGARQWISVSWHWPLLAYSGALMASTLASGHLHQNILKLVGDLYLVSAAALTVHYVTSIEGLRRTTIAWLAGTTVTAAASVAGVAAFYEGATSPAKNPFLFQFGGLPPGHYPRIRALFLNANMMCGFAIISTALVVAMRQAGWIPKPIFLPLLTSTIAAAAFSLSPGLGGLFLLWAFWRSGVPEERNALRLRRTAGVLAAIAFLAVSTISPPPFRSLPAAILHLEPSGRLQTWAGAWHSFLRSPWFGIGLEGEAARVRYVPASGAIHVLTDAHNTWLSILAHQGVAGLMAFLWVVLHLALRFQRSMAPGDSMARFRTGLELAMICGFLFPAFTGSYENTRYVWAIMGLVAAAQNLSEGNESRVVIAG